jgi:hypothetical protein
MIVCMQVILAYLSLLITSNPLKLSGLIIVPPVLKLELDLPHLLCLWVSCDSQSKQRLFFKQD